MKTEAKTGVNRLERHQPSAVLPRSVGSERKNRLTLSDGSTGEAPPLRRIGGHGEPTGELVDARCRLAEAQRLARLGHWEYYVAEGRSVWSNELYRILGYEPGGVEPGPEVILQHTHPDDRERMSEVLEGAFAHGRGFATDVRFYTVEGELRWGHARGEVFHDDQGKPLYVVGTGQDISEQKRLQLKLEETRQCLEQRIADSTRELRLANQILEQERESLRQKNIALKEVLTEVDRNRQLMARQMQKNISRIAMPLLAELEAASDPSLHPRLRLLSQCLDNVVDPTIDNLQQRAPELTSRQLQICHLIANGYSCKEIAALLNNSYQTVLKQRKSIRRKLGLTGKRINLASFLKSMGLSEGPPLLSGRVAERNKTPEDNGLAPLEGTPRPPKGSH